MIMERKHLADSVFKNPSLIKNASFVNPIQSNFNRHKKQQNTDKDVEIEGFLGNSNFPVVKLEEDKRLVVEVENE